MPSPFVNESKVLYPDPAATKEVSDPTPHGLRLEHIERIPPSPGDRLFYARVKELGLTESADLLLKGEELVIPTTRHGWPLP